jgi:hypothetical protein
LDIIIFVIFLLICQALQEELLREFNKQIFKEGMSYESSTSYHRLVTEIMYHFYLITTAKGITLPDTFMKGISRMLDAVAWCSYVYPKNTHAALSQDTQSIAHQIILVGDADSGTVLTGLPDHLFERMHVHYLIGAMHFPRFGLSLFKKDGWHMSLRHHAYHKSQPSSHVHNDAASITLAIQGLPFIVDPGSFVYTPSSQWRNHFRSVTAHNSFFIQHHEPVPFDERLFALNVPEVSDAGMCDAHEMVATTSHDLYARFGLRAQRTLMFDAPNECMTISDWWHVRGHYQDGLTSCWHFTFAPEVTVHRHAEQGWLLKRGDVMIHCASAHLTFTVEDAWVSTQYGAKRLSKKLVAKSPVTPGKHVGIQFSRI